MKLDFQRPSPERFVHLTDFGFTPKFAQVGEGGLQMHYVDEGDRSAPVALLLHGVPTWSYLYRSLIPSLVGAGFRVIAPDLIGFGRSDKLNDPSLYTYANQVSYIDELWRHLSLDSVHLVAHDWGGFIGLRLAGLRPDKFRSLTLSSTSLPDGRPIESKTFNEWARASQMSDLNVSHVVSAGCHQPLTSHAVEAYEAPFSNEQALSGVRALPLLIPQEPADGEAVLNRTAWLGLATFKKPVLTLFGEDDAIAGDAQMQLQRMIPGARFQPHAVLPKAGHYLQEDQPDLYASLVTEFIYRAESV